MLALVARSNRNLLHLVERDFVGAPVVELGGARRGVVGERPGVLKSALVLEIGGDAGRAEGVIADLGLDARRRPALDHPVYVLSPHSLRLAGLAAGGAE